MEQKETNNRMGTMPVNKLMLSMGVPMVLSMMLQEFADAESCVIVGRCADYILRDRDDVLNIFIHAPQADRAKRIVDVYGETGVEPIKRLREKDKKRAINYKYYTEQEWGRSTNYHMTLDSSAFGIEGCVDLIYKVLLFTPFQ